MCFTIIIIIIGIIIIIIIIITTIITIIRKKTILNDFFCFCLGGVCRAVVTFDRNDLYTAHVPNLVCTVTACSKTTKSAYYKIQRSNYT